jgi:hypothetical protein
MGVGTEDRLNMAMEEKIGGTFSVSQEEDICSQERTQMSRNLILCKCILFRRAWYIPERDLEGMTRCNC